METKQFYKPNKGKEEMKELFKLKKCFNLRRNNFTTNHNNHFYLTDLFVYIGRGNEMLRRLLQLFFIIRHSFQLYRLGSVSLDFGSNESNSFSPSRFAV